MDMRHYDPRPLIAARTAAGKSQEETAESLKVNRQTVYRIEAGISVSFELLSAYCSLYGIPVTSVIYPFTQDAAAV